VLLPLLAQAKGPAGAGEGKEGGSRARRARAARRRRHCQWMELGLEAERRFDQLAALEAYECAELAALRPEQKAEALARLSKQYSDMAWQSFAKEKELDFHPRSNPPAPPREEGARMAQKALELSEAALALDPDSAVVRVSKCANLGRLALYSDNKSMVRMSNRVKEEAERAIALDPSYDWAHHSLGRWHAAMASLPLVVKVIVKYYYQGEGCFSACHDRALQAYSTAKDLNPLCPNHRVELAKLLAQKGQRAAATAELQASLQMAPEDVNDWIVQEQGRRLLESLNGPVKV